MGVESRMSAIIVAIIGAVALVLASWMRRTDRAAVESKISDVQRAVGAVAKDAAQANEAVNHKEHGMPTLVDRVVAQDVASQLLATELVSFRAWQSEALERMAKEIGVQLPAQPPSVVTIPLAKPTNHG